jgi:hypothetical protein
MGIDKDGAVVGEVLLGGWQVCVCVCLCVYVCVCVFVCVLGG